MKTKWKNFASIIRNFRKKYRLNFRDQYTDKEVWHIHISAFNILTGLLAFVLVVFIAVASLIAYTPVLDMLPGYPGNRSRELLIRNVIKLDSMEQEMLKWEQFRENIALIMDGKTPVSLSVSAVDTVPAGEKEIVTPSQLDSALRRQMETDDVYRIRPPQKTRTLVENTFELFPPMKGVVTRRFDPQQSFYGIDITAATGQPVLSVLDGTVIMTTWTPQDGFVVQVQHAGNMVSTYKNLSRVVRRTGDRVRTGEAVGFAGTEGGDGAPGVKPFLYFELWHNGTAIDPETYISF